MNPSNELNRLIGYALNKYSSDMPVSAESLADVVIRKIDEDEKSPELVRFGCVLELRQMARALLRKEYRERLDDDSHPYFFGGLQDLYPGSGKRKGQYLPRSMMSVDDYKENAERLRKEGRAKLLHADELESEMNERIDNIRHGICRGWRGAVCRRLRMVGRYLDRHRWRAWGYGRNGQS